MITKDNLKEVLDSLQKEDIDQAMASNKEYVAVELNICNAGFTTHISAYNWSYQMSYDVHSAGNLFIDKNDLLRLAKEVGTDNEYLKVYM